MKSMPHSTVGRQQSSTLRTRVSALKRSIKRLVSPNPPSIRSYLTNVQPTALREAIADSNEMGVPKKISKYAFATPYGVKANCYAFFLTLPDSQWKDRHNKSQPGDMCTCSWSKTPLDFAHRQRVSNQLIRRIKCDNPGVVHFLTPGTSGYGPDILKLRLPEGYVLGCCIVGSNDYHFCRRESIHFLITESKFRCIWQKANENGVKAQLEEMHRKGHEYCWSHVAGWSGRIKLVDASNKVIINPVDTMARGAHVQRLRANRANHSYDNGNLHYDTFVGFFVVKARAAKLHVDNAKGRNDNAVAERLSQLGIRDS